MTVERPLRPRVLIGGLTAACLAAILYGMAANSLGATAVPGAASLEYLTFFVTLFAIRFNWARIAAVALLGLLTLLYLPGSFGAVGSADAMVAYAAGYVLLAAPLTVLAAFLVFRPASNAYYRRAARWRADLRATSGR